MKRRVAGIWLLCVSAMVLTSGTIVEPRLCPAAQVDDVARSLLRDNGVPGGLVVHLGCGDGRLTAAFRAAEQYVVHGLDASSTREAGGFLRFGGIVESESVAAPFRTHLGQSPCGASRVIGVPLTTFRMAALFPCAVYRCNLKLRLHL